MKTLIIMFAVGLMIQQTTQAQGTMTYLSNLDEPSTGSDSVGSDSWLAADFITGTNADGYLLDSVQLAMSDATGNPNGFTVMIYTEVGKYGANPGSSLGTLDGSANPSTAGIYTYTPDLSLMLSADTYYFIVLTAGTTVASGAYEWSLAGTYSYNSSGGWGVLGNEGQVATYWQSNQGSSWIENQGNIQFALTATAVPEPSSAMLLLLGSGALIYVRRTFKR